MTTREEIRAVWVELVGATKDYLKLPTAEEEEKQKKLANKSKVVKKKNGEEIVKNESSSSERQNKKLKKTSIFGEISKLIVATRTNPLFQALYVEALSKQEEIFSREQWEEEDLHVLGVDCEMIHVVGDLMSLARISVVEIKKDWTSQPKTILDELVLSVPKDFIVDTRPHITGLDVEDLCKRGQPKENVRKKFLSLLQPHTILIGHALDHDLLALGINYNRIVDTALLFMVEGKPELTHSLDSLSRVILKEETKRDKRGGTHDSIEDATLALKLVAKILSEPKLYEKSFPILLPKDDVVSKKQLSSGSFGAKARLLSTRVEIMEGSLKSKVADLLS